MEDLIRAKLEASGMDEFLEAVTKGDRARVRAMLAQDPSLVDRKSESGVSAVLMAVYYQKPELVSLLLDAGAEVNSASRNSQRVMPIHSSVASHSLDITRTLLENGADVNAVQQDGYTPLLEAAQAGELETLELLLQYGADPAARREDGQTALDLARQEGHSDIVIRLTRS